MKEKEPLYLRDRSGRAGGESYGAWGFCTRYQRRDVRHDGFMAAFIMTLPHLLPPPIHFPHASLQSFAVKTPRRGRNISNLKQHLPQTSQ